MNAVELKLTTFTITSSTFIHPSADTAKVLSEVNHSTRFVPVEVEGVKFFIEDLADEAEDEFGSIYTVYTSEGGSIWHRGSVNLMKWEWLFLVSGNDSVNTIGYMAYKTPNITKFVPITFMHNDVKYWEAKEKEDGEKYQGMVKYTKAKYKPAEITDAGEWSY